MVPVLERGTDVDAPLGAVEGPVRRLSEAPVLDQGVESQVVLRAMAAAWNGCQSAGQEGERRGWRCGQALHPAHSLKGRVEWEPLVAEPLAFGSSWDPILRLPGSRDQRGTVTR